MAIGNGINGLYSVALVNAFDNPGNTLPNYDISIRDGLTGDLVDIYSDPAGLNPIAQPGAKTNSRGVFSFYAANGYYIARSNIGGSDFDTPVGSSAYDADYAGFDAALFADADIVPSGSPDTAVASQRLDAVKKISGRRLTTTDEIITGKFKPGDNLCVTDRYDASFTMQGAGWPEVANGYDVIADSNGNVAVMRQYSEVYVDYFGENEYPTDFTTIAQAAYNYSGRRGGIKVLWAKETYKIDGNLYVSKRTETDFQQSVIIGANQNAMFTTGYVSSGEVISNIGTSGTDYSVTDCWGASFTGGEIRNAQRAFRLFKFINNASIKNIKFTDVEQYWYAENSFWSNYEEIHGFHTVNNFSRDSANIANSTQGSATITVPNAVAANAVVGRWFAAFFAEDNTKVQSVGAPDSGGAGFTNVVLDKPCVADADSSTLLSCGWSTWDSTILPRVQFGPENNDITCSKINVFGNYVGFSILAGRNYNFVDCDVAFNAKCFDVNGTATGIDVKNLYTEYNTYWLFDFRGCTSTGVVNIEISAPATGAGVAGIITAGTSGHVSGTITISNEMSGFIPFGEIEYPVFDLSSPNANVNIIGGAKQLLTADKYPLGKSVMLGEYGLKLQNKNVDSPKALDWYEEGAFTPTVEGATTAGAATYTVQAGVYTRIGNRVDFEIGLDWTGHTGAGQIVIKNWPFEPVAGGRFTPSDCNLSTLVKTAPFGQFLAFPSPYSMFVYQTDYKSAKTALTIPASGYIYLRGCYEVSS